MSGFLIPAGQGIREVSKASELFAYWPFKLHTSKVFTVFLKLVFSGLIPLSLLISFVFFPRPYRLSELRCDWIDRGRYARGSTYPTQGLDTAEQYWAGPCWPRPRHPNPSRQPRPTGGGIGVVSLLFVSFR